MSAESPYKRLPSASLKKVLGLWNLDRQRAAEGFGITTDQLDGWLKLGIPPETAKRIADLGAATDILRQYLKAD